MTTTTMTEAQALEEAKKLQEQLAKINKVFPSTAKTNGNVKRIVKIGEKGGLYIKDPSFKTISKAGKVYIAGINMDLSVAKNFFLNEELLTEVKELLAGLKEEKEIEVA